MDKTTWIWVVAILVLSLLFSLITKKRKSNKKYRYQKRPYLLTKNELNFYKSLLPAAQARRLVVCPKVRLADLIEPKKGQAKAAFFKIQAKHIDFVLCDPTDLKPILAVELDDKTHDRQDRQERDIFVNGALADAGVPILHTRTTANLASLITEKIGKSKLKV